MENLIYIVLGIIFFVIQIYRESEKLKKQSKPPKQESHLPDKQRHVEKFPPKDERDREVVARQKRSAEATTSRMKDSDEKKGKLYSGKNDKNPSVIKKDKVVTGDHSSSETNVSKEKNGTDNDYAGMFETPQSVRSAFIASEIFNRKHF